MCLISEEKYCGFKEIELKIAVKHLSCGLQHSMLLTVNGEVYTAGNNTRGQLGVLEDVSFDHIMYKIYNTSRFRPICLPIPIDLENINAEPH